MKLIEAWSDTYCAVICEYFSCKDGGGRDDKGCFESYQGYYPEEWEELKEEYSE